MTFALGCIADDYTGASDLANTLTRAGLKTIQTIGIPVGDLSLPDADAVVVALKSRSIAAAEAVEMSRAAHRWLRGEGASRVMFKICSTFDSTDAGNIGPVLDALRADIGEDIVVVTPAFPETGRSVYKGHLFVNDVLLSESPLKDHPLNPMRDPNLVRVLQRQSENRIGLVDSDVIMRGEAAVKAKLAEMQRAGYGAVIVDAISDDQLVTLGQVMLDRKFSVGASGLGFGIARALSGRGGDDTPSFQPESDAVGGYAACLAGSCSNATLEQIAVAEKRMPVLRLDPNLLMTFDGIAAQAIAWAAPKLAMGPVLIASSANPDDVRTLQRDYGTEATSARIERTMARIGEGLVESGVRRLIVAGGETSGAIVDALQLKAFLVEAMIAPGVPILRTLGSKRPMRVALKSGNFGGAAFFERALRMMR